MRRIQNHPLTFWIMAAATIGSLLFGFYAYQMTKPSRYLQATAFSRQIGTGGYLGLPIILKTINEDITVDGGYIHSVTVGMQEIWISKEIMFCGL